MSTAWVISAACFVVYVASMLAFALRQRRRADDDEARCGHCGYRTRGLPSSICPECGSDLNVVGLRRPTRWNRLAPAARRMITTLLWTIAVGWSAALASTPFRQFLQPGERTILDSWHGHSRLGPYTLGLERRWQQRTWGWRSASTPEPGWELTGIAVSINEKGVYGVDFYDPESVRPFAISDPYFVVDLRAGRCASCIPRYIQVSEYMRQLDEARSQVAHSDGGEWKTHLERWLDDVGRDRDHAPLRDEVMEGLEAFLRTPYRQFPLQLTSAFRSNDGAGYGYDWDPDGRYALPFLLVWFIAWLAGVFFLARAGRRGSRRQNACQPPAGGESQVQ
jgi:cbb3-type cytochrome oxidase subunit 3